MTFLASEICTLRTEGNRRSSPARNLFWTLLVSALMVVVDNIDFGPHIGKRCALDAQQDHFQEREGSG